jgi:pimeloyl-ACP methyl ester carboxylesterase
VEDLVADLTAGSGIAPVNGIQLYYEIHGEGSPLVLLHGAIGAVESFGPVLDALAAGRRVIGVDLQSHGRTPTVDRPMRFETMADDVAGLLGYLGIDEADVMGFSLGGGVALRLAIQHPELVRKAVLVSAPFKRAGWYPEMVAGMSQLGPAFAEQMKQAPPYLLYARIAPQVENWPVLCTQIGELLRRDYDWSAEVAGIETAVLIVAGDADGMPPSHAAEFFELLGGGKRDAGWDRSGMTRHRLAILPGLTHYDIDVSLALASTVITFLDEG